MSSIWRDVWSGIVWLGRRLLKSDKPPTNVRTLSNAGNFAPVNSPILFGDHNNLSVMLTEPPKEVPNYRATPTPDDIQRFIQGLPLFQQATAMSNYSGLPVEWPARLVSVVQDEDGKCQVLLSYGFQPRSIHFPDVRCRVDIQKNVELKIARIHQPVKIRGLIDEVRSGGTVCLRDAEIVFDAQEIPFEPEENSSPATQLLERHDLFTKEEKERMQRLAGIDKLPNPLRDSDPMVYVDIIDKRNEIARRTPFLLDNRGRGVAHKVQIHPVVLNVGTAKFKEIDNINAAKDREVVPEIAGAGIFSHDVLNLLHHEANHLEKGSEKEFFVSMKVTYEDVSGARKFEVDFDLVYSPFNQMMFQNHPLLKELKTICEVRNTRIRLVAE